MKIRTKKTVQSIVVILIVGFGFFQNLKQKSHIFNHLNPITIDWNNDSVNVDSLRSNEHTIYTYTTKIIRKGIQHIISTL